MKLHAILSYYDESPTWLAACIASLGRVDIDHVLAVDGRYPHFEPGMPACSAIEQMSAITETAASMGMGVTHYRPAACEPVLEPVKREFAFRMLGVIGEPMRDWVLVIDADEYVSGGDHGLREELAGLPDGCHTAACRVGTATDPFDEPGADNNVNAKTAEIHQKMPVDHRFASLQSRVFRLLDDMRVGPAHWDYTGIDASGERVHLRGDIGTQVNGMRAGYRTTPVEVVRSVEVMHRKNHRTRIRREAKKAYYDLRGNLGLEALPHPVAT